MQSLYNKMNAQWQGLGPDHLSPSSAEVKERVEPYIYYPLGPSWPVIG
jgi:hypothetical protein